MVIFLDMVGDLFHVGHLRAIKYIRENICEENDELYVGIISDKDTESYKRTPIINENFRAELIEGIKYVDKVIRNSPLRLTNDFINRYKITKICIPENRSIAEIRDWYMYIDNNLLVPIPYTTEISTTQIIDKIKNNY